MRKVVLAILIQFIALNTVFSQKKEERYLGQPPPTLKAKLFYGGELVKYENNDTTYHPWGVSCKLKPWWLLDSPPCTNKFEIGHGLVVTETENRFNPHG